MPWISATITLPESWWDAVRERDRLPTYFRELLQWASSRGYTNMHTQTFTNRVLDPFQAAKRYCRFLAAGALRFQLTEALWAAEPHPGGHGLHMHALWKSSYDARWMRLKQLSPQTAKQIAPLYKLVKAMSPGYGGYSRLWPIDDPNSQAVAYCLKYVMKDIRRLQTQRPPDPSDPMEREPMWGIWTPRQTTWQTLPISA